MDFSPFEVFFTYFFKEYQSMLATLPDNLQQYSDV